MYWQSGQSESKVRSMRGYEGSPTATQEGIILSLIQTLVRNRHNVNLVSQHYAMDQYWVYVRAPRQSITQLLILLHNGLHLRGQCCEHAGIRWQSLCEHDIIINNIVCVLAKIQITCQSSCNQTIRIVWCIKQFGHHEWCPAISRSRFLYNPEILHGQLIKEAYWNCTDNQNNQRSRLGTCGATIADPTARAGGGDMPFTNSGFGARSE